MPTAIKTASSSKRPRRKRKPTPAAALVSDQRIDLACRLDRGADVLLSWGNHLAAERLSLRAQALREAGR